jgi:DNA-binding transcriptional LysR family regulator
MHNADRGHQLSGWNAMDIDALRTFVAIARLGNFSRAAEALHRSQPAISRRVELLERELETPLFERVRGGAILTNAGSALLPYAEAALAAVKDGAEAVGTLKKGDSGRISLALVGTLANARMTEILQGYRQRHPGVRLDLQTATSQQIGELVQRGEATLGLRYRIDHRPGLVSKTVAEEELLVVGCAEHRLADGRRHRPSELAGERWVAFSSRTSRESFAQFLERKLLAAGLEDIETIPIDSLTAQKRLVEAGFGIALLAKSAVEEEHRLGTLRILDIPALRASIQVTVVYRRNGVSSQPHKTFYRPSVRSGSKRSGASSGNPGREPKRAAVRAPAALHLPRPALGHVWNGALIARGIWRAVCGRVQVMCPAF